MTTKTPDPDAAKAAPDFARDRHYDGLLDEAQRWLASPPGKGDDLHITDVDLVSRLASALRNALPDLAQARAELEFLRAKRWEAEADAGKAGRELDELRSAVLVYLEIHGRRLKWVQADGNGTWSDMFNDEQGQIARLRSLAGVEDTTEEKP